jgi:hypothetical protein
MFPVSTISLVTTNQTQCSQVLLLCRILSCPFIALQLTTYDCQKTVHHLSITTSAERTNKSGFSTGSVAHGGQLRENLRSRPRPI